MPLIRFKWMKSGFFDSCCLALAANLLIASSASAAETNLALGRPYSMSRPPDYPGCTDPGDTLQLTDGELTSGRLWTDVRAVGWTSKSAHPISITIDLGDIHQVTGASFSTAAGAADVHWPSSLDVFLSADGKTWSYEGDLRRLDESVSEEPTSYVRHRFIGQFPTQSGRYARVIIAFVNYAFVDEIEVFGSTGIDGTGGPRKILSPEEFVWSGKRYAALLQSLKVRFPRLGGLSTDLPVRAANEPRQPGKAVEPLNPSAAELFALNVAPKAGLFAWKKNRYDSLGPVEAPASGGQPRIRLRMLRSEWRADSIVLTNGTSRPVALRIRISRLPARARASFTVRAVPFVESAPGIDVAAALLVPMRGDSAREYQMVVPAGMNQELWLTAYSGHLAPGSYMGTLEVRGKGVKTLTIPISVHVSPIQFPGLSALHVGGFDYTDGGRAYDVDTGNRDLLASFLQRHFIDVTWAEAATVAPREDDFDAQGTFIRDARFDRLRAWLARWPAARYFFVYLAVGDNFAGAPVGTSHFELRLASWLKALTSVAATRGIGPGHLGFLLVDEPSTAAQSRTVSTWARAIHAAGTGLLVFENPLFPDPSSPEAREVTLASDILSPSTSLFLRYSSQQRAALLSNESPKQLWLYESKGSVRTLDPYVYYRLQAWVAFKAGAQGSQFWSFADAGGGSSWDERHSKNGRGFAPEYLDEHDVTDSKEMFAIVEGAEDYTQLAMLRAAAEDLETNPRLAAEAHALLANGVDEVLELLERDPERQMLWSTNKDREVADRVLLHVQALLERAKRHQNRSLVR